MRADQRLSRERATRLLRWSLVRFADRYGYTVEVIKNITYILALLAAGVWAIYTFVIKDRPLQQAVFDGGSDLTWTAGATPATCMAEWSVTLNNVSTRTLHVRRVDLYIWELSVPSTAGRNPSYVDVASPRAKGRQRPLFYKRYAGPYEPLTGMYAPRDVAVRSFEWVFNKSESPTWVVFETEVYTNARTEQPMWRAFSWSQVCEGTAPAPGTSSTPAATETHVSE
jgi:hypothetical protein